MSLDPGTLHRIATEAVGAGCRAAWADVQSGRTYARLSAADLTIVADLASRLAHRSELVRGVLVAERDAALLAYRLSFVRGYTLHLHDLSAIPEEAQRRAAEALVEVALEALSAVWQATPKG